MKNNNHIYNFLLQKFHDFPDEPSLKSHFEEKEDCPRCESVFLSIEKSVTVYREQIDHEEIPEGTRVRLRQVIRREWFMETKKDDKNK